MPRDTVALPCLCPDWIMRRVLGWWLLCYGSCSGSVLLPLVEGRANMYYDAIPGLHLEWFEDEKLARCHLKWDIPAKLVTLQGFSAAGTT